MPDGRFQTANGEVLGITATAATGAVEENGGVAGSAQEILNATSGGMGGGGRSGRGSGARGTRAGGWQIRWCWYSLAAEKAAC